MTDAMDDKITVEKIIAQQARELATQLRDDSDPDMQPWGGYFSKEKPKQVFPVEQIANS